MNAQGQKPTCKHPCHSIRTRHSGVKAHGNPILRQYWEISEYLAELRGWLRLAPFHFGQFALEPRRAINVLLAIANCKTFFCEGFSLPRHRPLCYLYAIMVMKV